jgi:hypothetical protein
MKVLRSAGDSAMKKYVGAAILILVALLAEFSPLLHINLGLDVHVRDEFYVIPFAAVIFWVCIVAAVAWNLLISVRGRPTRLR